MVLLHLYCFIWGLVFGIVAGIILEAKARKYFIKENEQEKK